jgi:multiple sugar transport system substrate-binding protein
MKTLITTALLTSLMAGGALADTTLKLVEVITSPERTETLKSIVGKFEAENPGTSVEIISLPWNEAFQKFATMVSAGDTPDVMEMPDTWLSLYANNGMLESLEPYLEKWENTKELTPRALELGRDVKDTAYMLPYGFYLRAMFYNKKLLEQAGVTEPPKTMEEFTKASEAVSKIPGKHGYCMRGGAGGLNGWMIFGASMAGDNAYFTQDGTSTMNSEGWTKGLEWSTFTRRVTPPRIVSTGASTRSSPASIRGLAHFLTRIPTR